MKNFTLKSVFAFLLILWFISPNYAKCEDLQSYSPLSEGNFWIYDSIKTVDEKDSRGEYKGESKIEVAGKKYLDNREIFILSNSRNDTSEYLVVEKDGLKQYKTVEKDGSYSIYSSPLMMLPFNIEETQEFEEEYYYYTYNSGNNLLEKGEISIEIKFENRENIIVRGKTFLDSVRILRIFTSESDIESSFKKKENIWFAKDIGIIKKIEEEFSFNPQKDKADISIDICELKKAFCYENY